MDNLMNFFSISTIVGAIGAVGISALMYRFLDRILVQVICRLFPSVFLNLFRKLIVRLNDYLEKKKASSKFPKAFSKVESELIEMLQDSIRIMKR